MTRLMLVVTSGVALTILSAVPAATQVLAFRGTAPRPPSHLADAYHLTLKSAWPQLGTPNGTCRNGGGEMVRGMVTRKADGTYEGTLDRTTLLYFCGTHGAGGDACELVLEGDGRVAVRGSVLPDAASPSGSALHLSWTPHAQHAAEVRGACSADFKHSIREMYLSVRHGAEFVLPRAGRGSRERLENYPWTVEIE